jgi:flavin-binding protein dodecin
MLQWGLAGRFGPNVYPYFKGEEEQMSVYKFIELVGTSTESWEKAAQNAVETAGKSLRNIRVAEVLQMDMHLEDGKVSQYRTKIKLSFKYEGS